MAGFLDALFGGTPDQQRAIGLLGAGMVRGDFAGGATDAMGLLAGAEQRALQKKLIESQIAENAAQAEARKLAAEKQTQLLDMAKRIALGGGAAPAVPGQLGSGSFGVVSAPTGMPDMPTPRPRGIAGADFNEITALHAYGGPDLTNAYKFAREGIERKPGSFYEDLQGRRQYIADPKSGIDFQNGRITPIPGHTDFLSATTMATEGPKALLASAGKVNLRKNADGTERPVSELDENPTLRNLLGGFVAGGMAPAPAAPAPMAPTGRPVIAPAAQKAADAESIRMIEAELQNPQLPADQRAGLQRELSRLTASQSQPGFPTPTLARPTPAQGYGKTTEQQAADEVAKTEATTRAEIRVKDLEEMRKNITAAGFSAPQRIAKYQQLGALLADVDGGKLTATGTALASAMNSLGLKVDKNLPNKEAAAALGNEMALQLRSPASGAGMPGAMSDKDREFLVGMIPNASQTLEGRKMLIQAQIALAQREQQVATFMRNYEKKYGKLDNGFFEQMQAWSEANPLFKGQ